MNGYDAADILTTPEADAAEESAIAVEKAFARSAGQGFGYTPEQRKALEDHAMAAAKRHFKRAGYKVDDVSSSRPYDLRCLRNEKELHVEVKGTTTSGEAIVLTNNEVKHACDGKHPCALFVLHSITSPRVKNVWWQTSGVASMATEPQTSDRCQLHVPA